MIEADAAMAQKTARARGEGGYDAAMRPRVRLAHALAAGACALALVAAGCGDDDQDTGEGTRSAPAETTAIGSDETAAVDGKEIFAANCASCHTLADADANGSFGPNLDERKPDAATVEAKVKNGGGGMPAFDGQLDDAEIAAVAAYVAENAG